MKKFKKVLCCLLSLLMFVSAGVFGTSAALAPQYYGDSNGDHEVDIKDATHIQKYLAGDSSVELSKMNLALADIDRDGKIAVKDATFIRKALAEEIDYDFYENSVIIDTHLLGLYMDYKSGKAMVGEPVTFTAKGYTGTGDYTTTFIVNDEVVFEGAESDTWQYTFDEAGKYRIKVEIESMFGRTSNWVTDYEVVEAYEINRLTFTAIMPDDFYPSVYTSYGLVAYAKGGKAPYEYSFAMVDAENNLLCQQDFSKDNIFHIPFGTGADEMYGTYTVWVSVKDAEGISYNEPYILELGDPRPPA